MLFKGTSPNQGATGNAPASGGVPSVSSQLEMLLKPASLPGFTSSGPDSTGLNWLKLLPILKLLNMPTSPQETGSGQSGTAY